MYELAVLAVYILAVFTLSTISLGLLSDLLVDNNGSAGIAAAEVITLALGAAVSIPVTTFLITDASIWEFAIVGTITALGTVWFISGGRNEDAREAPAIVEFATQNFDLIDTGRTGQITRNDIYNAIDSGSFKPDDVRMLKRMLRRVEAIGHPYDWMAVDSYPAPSFPVALYAIDRADLEQYVERTSRYRGGILA